MMIIWCMVPEISSTTDFFVISGYFLSFYPPNNPENQNFGTMKKNSRRYHHFKHEHHRWKSYDVWFLRYGAQQTDFFSHFGLFFALLHPPLLPPNNPENQKFEKTKKTPGDIITLHKCTKKSWSYAIFSSDKTSDRCNCYFSFWAICFLWCQFMMQLMYRHFRVQFDDSWFIFHSSSWHFHESYFCWKQIFHKSYRVDKTQDNGL